MTRFYRPLFAIARVTAKDILNDRVLYNTLVCAALLLFITYLAGQVNFLEQYRILLNFGHLAVWLSSSFLAIFSGAALIRKEFERRTVHVSLSRPISLLQFILGRYLGLVAVLSLNWLLLSIIVTIMYFSFGGTIITEYFSLTAIVGLFLVLPQVWMIAALATCFSTFMTTALSAVCTIGIWIIGSNSNQLQILAEKAKSPVGKTVFEGLLMILPNLERLNLSEQMTYGLPVPWTYAIAGALYAFFYAIAFLIAAGSFGSLRET